MPGKMLTFFPFFPLALFFSGKGPLHQGQDSPVEAVHVRAAGRLGVETCDDGRQVFAACALQHRFVQELLRNDRRHIVADGFAQTCGGDSDQGPASYLP